MNSNCVLVRRMKKKWGITFGLALLLCVSLYLHADSVVETDTNRDGKPDGWTYILKGQIEKQELDINFDGKVDTLYLYEGNNVVREEILDTDYDGNMDNWRIYDNGELVADNMDSDHDGRIDIWISIDRGRIYKVRKDTSGDGKPDTSVEY
jgi:hypothetical protein